MDNEQSPQTYFEGSHTGCYVKVPHEHYFNSVMTGYVLGEVMLTLPVVLDIIPLLKSQSAEQRRFSARNLIASDPDVTAFPLVEALDREEDAFTAGVMIATLGTLKRREVVEAVRRWISRADEPFVADNIMESYLKIWMDTSCNEERDNKFCQQMYEGMERFVNSENELIAQRAKRIFEVFNLAQQ